MISFETATSTDRARSSLQTAPAQKIPPLKLKASSLWPKAFFSRERIPASKEHSMIRCRLKGTTLSSQRCLTMCSTPTVFLHNFSSTRKCWCVTRAPTFSMVETAGRNAPITSTALVNETPSTHVSPCCVEAPLQG